MSTYLKNLNLVFPSATEDDSQPSAIRVYLGVHHLFGFRQWPAESKAKFLDQNIRTTRDLEKLAKEVGLPKAEFERYLIPYRLRRHAEKAVGRISVKDFWTLGESLNRAAIKEYLNLETDPKTMQIKSYDKDKLRYLLGFLYGVGGIARRITETRQIGILARVLGSKKGSAALEKGSSLEEALLYISPKHKTSGDLADKLENILRRIVKLRPREPELGRIIGILEIYHQKLRAVSKNA